MMRQRAHRQTPSPTPKTYRKIRGGYYDLEFSSQKTCDMFYGALYFGSKPMYQAWDGIYFLYISEWRGAICSPLTYHVTIVFLRCRFITISNGSAHAQ